MPFPGPVPAAWLVAGRRGRARAQTGRGAARGNPEGAQMDDDGTGVFRVYALRYAHRDAVRAEHFYGHDPCGDQPMPMDYFVWAATSPRTTLVIDAGFSHRRVRRNHRVRSVRRTTTWQDDPGRTYRLRD